MIHLAKEIVKFDLVEVRLATVDELLSGSHHAGPLLIRKEASDEPVYHLTMKGPAGRIWIGYSSDISNEIKRALRIKAAHKGNHAPRLPTLMVNHWRKYIITDDQEYSLEEGVAWFEFNIFHAERLVKHSKV